MPHASTTIHHRSQATRSVDFVETAIPGRGVPIFDALRAARLAADPQTPALLSSLL